MMDFTPTIIRATSDNIDLAVKAAAEDDKHGVLGASHLILKNNECVGYLGIGTIPALTLWMDTRKTKIRDSMFVEAFAEEVINHQLLPKGGVFFLPAKQSSPYFEYLDKVGFVKTDYTHLFIKRLYPI